MGVFDPVHFRARSCLSPFSCAPPPSSASTIVGPGLSADPDPKTRSVLESRSHTTWSRKRKYQHRHWLVPARSAEGLLAHAQKAVGVAHQVDLVQVQVPADELDEGRGRAQRRLLGSGSILSLSASLGPGVELAAAGAKATATLQGRSGRPVALQKEVAAAMGIGVQLTSFSR